MPNNNGIITAPVGIGSVQQAIGSSADNIKVLCTNSGINKFSAHKPIEVANHVAALSDAEYKANNWGINLTTYSTADAAFDALTADTGFSYNKPTTVGRITDFNTYNHYATNKWVQINMDTNVGRTDSLTINFRGYNPLEGFYEGSVLSELITWGYLSPFASNLNFGLLLRQTSQTADFTYYMPLTDASTPISSFTASTIIKAPLNGNLANGTWYAYPIFTTAIFVKNSFNDVTQDTSYNWFLVPIGNLSSFIVSDVSPNDPINKIRSELISYELSASGNNYTLRNVVIKITNTNDAQQTVQVSANIVNPSTALQVEQDQKNIPSNSNANYTFADLQDCTFTTTFTNIELRITMQISGWTSTRQDTFAISVNS